MALLSTIHNSQLPIHEANSCINNQTLKSVQLFGNSNLLWTHTSALPSHYHHKSSLNLDLEKRKILEK